MPSHQSEPDKPEVLKRPNRLLKFVGLLVALIALVYVAMAATAFLKQERQGPVTPRSMATAELQND
jgi:predicted lysophospholipase L1 biosynthesis ABC-type transport system permease subunit